MLDEKDKLIIDYLMNDCRISTTKLAKMTGLSQPSIVYRIKRVEKEGYISRYDALLDFDKVPVSMYVIFIDVKTNLEDEFRSWCFNNKFLMSLFRHIHMYNYSITSFLNSYNLAKVKKYLNSKNLSYKIYRIKKHIFLPYSIFNLLPPPRAEFSDTSDFLKLDKDDYKIMKHMMNGGARDSVRKISEKTGLGIDLVTYRIRKYIKKKYFRLFLAQPDHDKFQINTSIIFFRVKSISLNEVAKKVQRINKTLLLGQLEDNAYFATTQITSLVDYKKTLKQFYRLFEANLVDLDDLMVDDWVFLNRLNLEMIL